MFHLTLIQSFIQWERESVHLFIYFFITKTGIKSSTPFDWQTLYYWTFYFFFFTPFLFLLLFYLVNHISNHLVELEVDLLMFALKITTAYIVCKSHGFFYYLKNEKQTLKCQLHKVIYYYGCAHLWSFLMNHDIVYLVHKMNLYIDNVNFIIQIYNF